MAIAMNALKRGGAITVLLCPMGLNLYIEAELDFCI
jgi:hypothetical protein